MNCTELLEHFLIETGIDINLMKKVESRIIEFNEVNEDKANVEYSSSIIATVIIDSFKLNSENLKSKVNLKGKPRDEVLLCKTCGTVVIQTPGRKAKKFCSDRCRMKWWNSHADQVNKKATYDLVCMNCGCSFQAYGNSKRKYCCHECYVEDRFGKKGKPVRKIDERSKAEFEPKPVTTREQGNNEIYFSITMYWVKRMYDEGIITAIDYNTMREMMIEKYHPVTGSLFYDKIKEE